MGNLATCQMSNYSGRDVRVFLRDKSMEIDNFLTAASEGAVPAVLPGDKKFHFKKDVDCIRVLASQTKEVPWKPQQFLSVFVEDDDDENICLKQIVHNMALSAPVTVLIYDV